MERFHGSRVHVHLGKSPINTKLHNRGRISEMGELGLILSHGDNKISFFPWTNILRVDLIEEVIIND